MPVQPRPGRTPRPRRPAASVRRPPRWSRGGGGLDGTLGRTVRPLMSMGTAARLGAEGKLERSAAEASTSRVADGASRVAAGVAKAFGGRLVSRARARAAELVTAAASRSPFAVSRFQRSLKMAMGRGLDRRLLREGRRKTAVAKRAGLESVVVASAVGSARSALRSPAGPSPRAASALSRSRPLLFRSGRPLPSSPPGFLTAQRLSPSVRLRPLSRGPASRRPAVRQRPEPPCRPYARLL